MNKNHLIKTISVFLAALLILCSFPGASLSSHAEKADPAGTKDGLTPQAIWTRGDATLTFVCESEPYSEGGTIHGQIITEIWGGKDVYGSPAEGPAWNETVCDEVEKVVFEESFTRTKPSNLAYWFYCFTELTEIQGIQYLDTSVATDMSFMFRSCNYLESLDLSTFNTAKVTSMEEMFSRCFSLAELIGLNFNTSNVTNMAGMFNRCEELTVLDLESFDVSKVETAEAMFAGDASLETIFCRNSSESDWQFSGSAAENVFAENTALKGQYGKTTVSYVSGQNGREYARSAKLGGYFTPKYMTIRFDANEGSGSMDDVEIPGTLITSDSTALPANTFKREGYSFTGWNTMQDGTGTAYADKAQITASEDLLLYAQWKKEDVPFWTRLSGEDRFETMEKVLDEAYEGGSCKTLIIASGMEYADALAGASLAGVYECPIILSSDTRLLESTKKEIKRLASPEGCDVYILGGPASVSDSVKNAINNLKNEGVKIEEVKRIYGDDREVTALRIAELGDKEWGDTVILAAGNEFADALAISPYAYAAKAPILLGRGNGSIAPEVKALIESRFTKVLIVGGPGSISESTENALKANNNLQVVRLSGDDRFETALKVLKWELGQDTGRAFQPEVEMTADGMGIVSGLDFPDALGSVSILGRTKSVLALVSNASADRPSVETMINEIIAPNALSMEKGYIFGGEASVSKDIKNLLEQAVK